MSMLMRPSFWWMSNKGVTWRSPPPAPTDPCSVGSTWCTWETEPCNLITGKRKLHSALIVGMYQCHKHALKDSKSLFAASATPQWDVSLKTNTVLCVIMDKRYYNRGMLHVLTISKMSSPLDEHHVQIRSAGCYSHPHKHKIRLSTFVEDRNTRKIVVKSDKHTPSQTARLIRIDTWDTE